MSCHFYCSGQNCRGTHPTPLHPSTKSSAFNFGWREIVQQVSVNLCQPPTLDQQPKSTPSGPHPNSSGRGQEEPFFQCYPCDVIIPCQCKVTDTASVDSGRCLSTDSARLTQIFIAVDVRFHAWSQIMSVVSEELPSVLNLEIFGISLLELIHFSHC